MYGAEVPSDEDPSDSEDEAGGDAPAAAGGGAVAASAMAEHADDAAAGSSRRRPPCGQRTGMSRAHRTGMAKIPTVVEWLMLALGLGIKAAGGTTQAVAAPAR